MLKHLKLSIMAASLLAMSTPLAASSDNDHIISRPDIKVVDGKFTPDLMEAFGRVTDPQLSPDGKTVLYNVEFISLEADKGNKELWTMGIDGSNAVRITETSAPEIGAVWINGGKKIAFLSTS